MTRLIIMRTEEGRWKTAISTYINGHFAYFDIEDTTWKYADTHEPATIKRPCIKCGQLQTKEGHDYCIRNLPGVKNACCGHGVEEGYIQFEDGRIIRGTFSVEGK